MTYCGPQELGVQEGEILAGKYRVERVLGIGGMGVVVAAHHIQLDEKVALKVLRPEALGDADAVARFGREARTAVKIKSEHVVRVIDVGALPNGAPYIVMEYLEGGDLDAWIEQRGVLPIDQAIEFVLQTCVAVADVHAMGMVHRDLKPANLFCVRRTDGRLSIKLLDFGISKGADRSGPASVSLSVTARGLGFPLAPALMGSPLYMSPEQMRDSKDVDSRTDIWALGVILFELLAGRTPYSAVAVTELAIKIATEATPSIRGFRPEVPPALEAVIGTCLEKDPRQRFADVGELALALLPFAPKRATVYVERISGILNASGLSADALESLPSPRTAERQDSAGTLPALGRTMSSSTGRKATAVGVSLVGAVLLVASVGVMWREPPPGSDFQAAAVRSKGLAVIQPTPHVDPQELPAVRRESPPTAPPASPDAGDRATAETATTETKKPSVSIPVLRPLATPARASVQAPRCDPPYYFDANGNRLFKKECL